VKPERNKFLPIVLLVLPVLFSILFPLPTRADVGPKPELIIVVKNPPEQEYYLDLLVPEPDDPFNNLDHQAIYDQVKLDLLKHYEIDGWTPALVRGTGVPMSGNLVGERMGSTMRHTFGYVGVPDEFKIILVTPEAELVVSRVVSRSAFQETMTYDYATGEVQQRSLPLAYLRQFLATCLPTLLIEGAVLLLFRYSLRRNWKSVLTVNVITQVFLTAVFGTTLLRHGTFSAFLLFVPVEIAILLGETIAYSFLLREHGRKRAVLYAVVANLCSAIIGAIWLMRP